MKKALKIAGFSLLSILGVLLVVVGIAIWFVFTPEKLTPAVQKQLPKFITCKSNVEKVDLTFFGSFPHFGLHLQNLTLVNPANGSCSDTLAHIHDLTATVDVKEWLKSNNIVLQHFYLKNVSANIFIDSLGNTNYDIFPPSEEDTNKDTTSFVNPFDIIDLQKISIENLTACYIDQQSGIEAKLNPTDIKLDAQIIGQPLDGNANIALQSSSMYFILNDSAPISAIANNLDIQAKLAKKEKQINGTFILCLPDISFKMGSDNYLKSANISLTAPFTLCLNNMLLNLKQTIFSIEQHKLTLDGTAQYANNKDIILNMNLATEQWDLKKAQALIPETYSDLLKDIDANGLIQLKASVVGILNDSLIPQIKADILYANGKVAYNQLPYVFRDVNADLQANIDINKDSVSDLTIRSLRLKTRQSYASVSGTVNDLLGKMKCNIRLHADLNLPDAKPILPEDLNATLEGRAIADLTGRFTLDQITNMQLNRIQSAGTIRLKNLNAIYNDSLFIKSPSATLTLNLPSSNKNNIFKELAQLQLKSPVLDAEMLGLGSAQLNKANINIGISDFTDTTKLISLRCNLDMEQLHGNMDTITIDINKPTADITLIPSANNTKNPDITCLYSNASLNANIGKFMEAKTQSLKIKAKADYDNTQKELILQWNPELNIDLHQGGIKMDGIAYPIQIPSIEFDFTPKLVTINKSSIIIDQSDFSLSGIVKNIDEYLKNTDLLKAELDFESKNTNVNQLMDIVSGFGSDETSTATQSAAQSTIATNTTSSDVATEDNPFMVPKGVDVQLTTMINNARVGDTDIQNVGGKLTVKDGVMVLEQMGFTCDAANMQLTALYRSDRKNHLFAGIDFHLLNIDIDKLIHMVPDIDTIVPMLKSFAGKAEFHLTAETYMKSNYDLKFSTLRGAAAIEGKDLVVLDGETFSTIAKYLMFNKKTENKIDSLSVEMTVFKNEVDLYPFLISMDKYKAVLSGRHNIDMTFDYHVETLAPIRLGLGVSGNLDNLKYKLEKTKYANMYKPEKRNVMQERTLALKKLISDALKSNVKEIPEK